VFYVLNCLIITLKKKGILFSFKNRNKNSKPLHN
jgi:hypothetical protein